MKQKPTGYVARCQCGSYVGALDIDRTERKEAGKLLGAWLAAGCDVLSRFGGCWTEKIQPCRCESKLSPRQLHQLHRVDRAGAINEEDRAVLPGVHFCPDWDEMAICDDSPEKDCCTCKLSEVKHEQTGL